MKTNTHTSKKTMRKILLGMAAALLMAACSENKPQQEEQEACAAADTASVANSLIMSRRSIRAYKNTPIGRETLDEILQCGINAPNGQNLARLPCLTESFS